MQRGEVFHKDRIAADLTVRRTRRAHGILRIAGSGLRALAWFVRTGGRCFGDWALKLPIQLVQLTKEPSPYLLP